jgi:hypothetical protein
MPAQELAIPYDYLRNASVPTLESFELSRLNHAANLRREIDDLLDQYFEESLAALLARFLLQRRTAAAVAGRRRGRRPLAPKSNRNLPEVLNDLRGFARVNGLPAGS